MGPVLLPVATRVSSLCHQVWTNPNALSPKHSQALDSPNDSRQRKVLQMDREMRTTVAETACTVPRVVTTQTADGVSPVGFAGYPLPVYPRMKKKHCSVDQARKMFCRLGASDRPRIKDIKAARLSI